MTKFLASRRDVLAGAAALTSTWGGLVKAGVSAAVRLGQVDVPFYAVTGAVVEAVLKRLGHSVTIVPGAHEVSFPRLATGQIDLLAAAWLPGAHRDYVRRYGADTSVAAVLYEGAKLFWAVPAYVPANVVRSIADLARPDVAGRMEKRIRSIGPGSGLTTRSAAALSAYGLDRLGYSVKPGPVPTWTSEFERAVADRRWTVQPLWRPHHLNVVHELRVLDDPLNSFGAQEDRAVLLARSAFLAKLHPDSRRVLSRVQLGIDGVTEMDRLVAREGLSPRQAAKRWMTDNAAIMARWFDLTR